MPSNREIDELSRRYYNVSELLRMGWIIFKANIGPILIITACIYLPLCIVEQLIQQNADVIQNSLNFTNLLSSREMLIEFFSSETGKSWIMLSFINTFLEMVFAPLVIVAIAKLAQSFIYDKDTSNPGKFVAFALSKIHWVIICNIICKALIMLGFVAFIIPGILFLIIFYFVNYAISLSDRRGLSSLKHSLLLSRGRKFRIFAYGIAFFLMSFVIEYFVGYAFAASVNQFSSMVLMKYILGVNKAFFTIPIAIWYLNMEFTAMIRPYSDETVLDDDE